MPPKRKLQDETDHQATKRQRILTSEQDIALKEHLLKKHHRLNEKHNVEFKEKPPAQFIPNVVNPLLLDNAELLLTLVFQHVKDEPYPNQWWPKQWLVNVINNSTEELCKIEEDYSSWLKEEMESDYEECIEEINHRESLYSDSCQRIGMLRKQQKERLFKVWKCSIARPEKFIL